MNKFIFQLALTLFITSSGWAQDGADLARQATELRKQIENGPPQFSLIGKLERGDDSEFSVNGEDFVIDSDTRINGNLQIGRSAMVRGDRIGDRNYAKKILVEQSDHSSNSSQSRADVQDEVPLLGSGPAPLPGQKPLRE
jgi:hypothetical protein